MAFEVSQISRHPVEDAVTARRRELFRETPVEQLRRWTLGVGYALKPSRLAGLPTLSYMLAADLLSPDDRLPDPDAAFTNPPGLCGVVQDLSLPTLVEAHRRGLYPFAHIAPLKWWSPPERCVLFFDRFHMAKRLRARLRQSRHTVTFDRDFEQVIKACAAPRDRKWPITWITPQIMHAYAALHDAGYAHSFEVWNESGELVGGGYGVAIGDTFTIESQFTRQSHCSKIGFAMLNWHLAKWGFRLSDNKGPTRNTLEMGFQLIPRHDFLRLLREFARAPGKVGRWSVETDLPTVAAWEPAAGQPQGAFVESPPPRAAIRVRATAGLLALDVIDGELVSWGLLGAML